MRFTLRVLAFALLTATLYLSAMALLALVEVGGAPLYEGLARLPLRPAEGGHTAARMAEFDRLSTSNDTLDVLFVGSSLTYRGIDARVFERRGLDVFALGLSSQTPLNYAPLLAASLPRVPPRAVVFEAAPDLFQSDGMEAFYAYAVNQPLEKQTLAMARSVRSVRAFNLLAALAWYRAAHPYGTTPPLPADTAERYVGKGFTARSGTLTAAEAQREAAALPPENGLRPRQLGALRHSVRLARAAGSETAFVVPPTHPLFRAHRPRLDVQTDSLRAIAASLGVPFLDLSRLPLDPYADFSDLTHLSARGVIRYDAALADSLHRVLKRPTSVVR